MTICRGEIWLANLNPQKKSNEVGKTRPVLVFQNNYLNDSGYPTTIIFPLTTQTIDDSEPLRYRLHQREGLDKNSDVLIAQIRAIDNSRFLKKLTAIDEYELEVIKNLFDDIVSK
jgi:mRNA interferase MazF